MPDIQFHRQLFLTGLDVYQPPVDNPHDTASPFHGIADTGEFAFHLHGMKDEKPGGPGENERQDCTRQETDDCAFRELQPPRNLSCDTTPDPGK
jgi:hypothetical protein